MATQKTRARSSFYHIHDLLFKVYFSDPTIAEKFLLLFMPKNIHQQLDFSSFLLRSPAHVSSRFGVSYSDVLYETHLRHPKHLVRVAILFEHKSRQPSLAPHFQLLDYMLQLWE